MKNISISLVLGLALLIGLTHSALAQDLGFRYRDGKCAGYNPDYLGQCGQHIRKNFFGKSLAGMDLRGSNFNQSDLREADLTGAKLEGAQMKYAFMVNTQLADVDLKNADLSGIQIYSDGRAFMWTMIKGANFSQSNLQDATMQGVTWIDSKFIDANLMDSQLIDITFEQSDLSGAQLEGSDLSKVRFMKSKLDRIRAPGANLSGLDLSQSNFSGADFTGANLAGSQLTEAKFDGAILKGADLRSATGDSASYVGADLSEAQGQESDLRYSNFNEANLEGSNFRKAQLEESTFIDVQATGAKFNEAELKETEWSGARLDRAYFDNAVMTQAKLDFVSAAEASFKSVNLRQADLRSGRFRNANFYAARMDNTNLEYAFFRGARFQSANLENSKYEKIDLKDATFSPRSKLPFDRAEAEKMGMVLKGVWNEGDLVYLFSPTYTQTNASAESEGYTLKQFFVMGRHKHRDLTDISKTALERGLDQAGTLVIPENIGTSIAQTLTNETAEMIKKWVMEGGVLVSIGHGNQNYLNRIFGWNIGNPVTGNLESNLMAANAIDTPFEGASPKLTTLTGSDPIHYLDQSQLPAGARIIYLSTNNTVAVFFKEMGEGYVAYFAWDWNEAAPAYSQDGGWLNLMGRATGLISP